MGKWPHDYYGLVETDVVSGVMGIKTIGDSEQESLKKVNNLLSLVKADWPNIAKLETADALIEYLYGRQLASIAEVIQQTLAKDRSLEPSGEFHIQLQAMAIKRGLISAYKEVQNKLSL
jgi:predicted RNA-binding protein